MRRRGDQPLARALSTPWRLTLAAAVYDQRDPATGAYLHDPADLTRPGLDTEEKIRDHLLGLFIPAATAAYGGHYPACRVHQWLGMLASYLDSNTPTATRPARVIAGRTLSGTDLVLHELWPLAGPRAPRALTTGLTALILLGNPIWWLTHLPIESPTRLALAATVLAIAAIGSMSYVWTAWPKPRLLDFRQLRTGPGRRRFAYGSAPGFALGFLVGFAVRLADGLAVRLAEGLASGLANGIAGGIASGLVFGLDPGQSSATRPQQIVRSSLTFGLASAPVVGLAATLASGLTRRFADGLAGGLTGGAAAALILGLVGWRYLSSAFDVHPAMEQQPLAPLAAGKLPALVLQRRIDPHRRRRLPVPSPRTAGLPRPESSPSA
jgi:hypothetical protein